MTLPVPSRTPTMSAKFLGSALRYRDGAPYGGTFQPQMSYLGFVLFRFDTSLISGFQEADNKIILMSLESSSLPEIVINTTTLSYNNERRKYPTSAEFPDFELTLRDFVDIPTARIIDKWLYLIYNEYNGAINPKIAYRVNTFVCLIDPTGNLSRYYRMICFPISVNFGNIDGNSSDYVKINVTLAIDKLYRVPEDELKDWGLSGAGTYPNSRDFNSRNITQPIDLGKKLKVGFNKQAY